jgi:hypothetical protein
MALQDELPAASRCCSMRAMDRRLLPALALISYSLHAADLYFPPPDSEGGWREAKDSQSCREKAGMDLAELEAAYILTDRSTAHGGLVVVRRGWLCFERYFGRASRNANPDMASTGKGFCSIACGIMLEEFKDKIPEGLDTNVFTEQFLPQAFPLNDPRKADRPCHSRAIPLVGFDDAPDHRVTDDVGLRKSLKGNSLNALQRMLGLSKPRAHSRLEIHL